MNTTKAPNYTNMTTATSTEESIHSVSYVFILIIGLVLFVLNAVASTVLLTNKRLRSVNHTFILISLSFSDALVGASLVFISAEALFSLTNKAFCCVWIFLGTLPTSTSLCQILLICINRYTSMQTESKYRKLFSGKKKYTVTIAVWAINIVYFLVIFALLVENTKLPICTNDFLFGNNIRPFKAAEAAIILPVYILSLAFYAKTLIQLRRRLRVIQQNVTAGIPVPASNSKQYLVTSVKTISIVVILLLILLGPFVVEICVETFTSYKIAEYVSLGSVFNALANPLVYLWRIKDFRMAVSCGKWQ